MVPATHFERDLSTRMIQTLPVASPALGEIVLDEQTQRLFPDKYFRGRSEYQFILGSLNAKGVVLQGRAAPLLSGAWVVVAQQKAMEGQMLRLPYPILILTHFKAEYCASELSSQQRQNFWDEFFHPLHATPGPYPEADADLWRGHYSKETGWGCLVGGDHMRTRLLDLRAPVKQLFSTSSGAATLRLGDHALATVGAGAFYTRVESLFHDTGTRVYQEALFQRLNEDERCREMVGQNTATVNEVEKAMKARIRIELYGGGVLTNYTSVRWCFWTQEEMEAILRGGGQHRLSAPDSLKQYRAQLFAQWECKIPKHPKGRIGDAKRAVWKEWWKEREIEVLEPSGHEVAVELSHAL